MGHGGRRSAAQPQRKDRGPRFRGTLDLLVYLVQKNEVDIWDIPIALITEQFLAYIQGMTAERLESAGESSLMAATLLRIKSQMLLPRPRLDDEEELEDPRRELVLKILEYQQFREIAEQLRERESAGRLVFPRGMQEWDAEILDEAGWWCPIPRNGYRWETC